MKKITDREWWRMLRTIAHVPTVLREEFFELYGLYFIIRSTAIILALAMLLVIADIPLTDTSPVSTIVGSSVEATEVYDQICEHVLTIPPPIEEFDADKKISLDNTEENISSVEPVQLSSTLEKEIDAPACHNNDEPPSDIGPTTAKSIKPEKKKKAKKKKKYRYKIRNDEEFETFCRCVEAEVTGESPNGLSQKKAFECKLHVAQVILNRVESKSFPNTITDVVYQKEAFSPLIDGRFWDVEIVDVTREACKAALLKSTEDTTYGCEYFSANTHYCKWGYEVFTDDVNHTFFKEDAA